MRVRFWMVGKLFLVLVIGAVLAAVVMLLWNAVMARSIVRCVHHRLSARRRSADPEPHPVRRFSWWRRLAAWPSLAQMAGHDA